MSPRRSWLPHVGLALALAAELGVFLSVHRTNEELQRQAFAGDAKARIGALHALTNRGTLNAKQFGRAFLRPLLEDPDELIREYAFTTDVCKFSDIGLQEDFLRRDHGDDRSHWWRCYVIHRRKVGGESLGAETRLGRVELLWFLVSFHGKLERGEIDAHLRTLFER